MNSFYFVNYTKWFNIKFNDFLDISSDPLKWISPYKNNQNVYLFFISDCLGFPYNYLKTKCVSAYIRSHSIVFRGGKEENNAYLIQSDKI